MSGAVRSRPASSARAEPSLSVVIGRRVRRLRVERGWSRQFVAMRLGLPSKHVEEHERGTKRIEAHELAAYIRLFRIRISTFFRDPPAGGCI
jgi:transcriptional regulator with XRE-family HTH domain